jgi:BASS family bile acid:Na+ symporter
MPKRILPINIVFY